MMHVCHIKFFQKGMENDYPDCQDSNYNLEKVGV